MSGAPPCRVCGGETVALGGRHSQFSGRTFQLVRCGRCAYAFVADPRDDFANLYDEDYYAGRGADPLTDYAGEIANSRSVRVYEWEGMLQIAEALGGDRSGARWLDHGCGLGGAIRYARARGFDHAYGLDEGYAGEALQRDGVPSVTRGNAAEFSGSFDVVTSIDVLEHTVDPVGTLREIRTFLKPGGMLFLTTGNAAPFREKLLTWSYTGLPDVHVGFFEPQTIRTAYLAAGLTPMELPPPKGFHQMLRYKILKNLKVGSRSRWEGLVPWGVVARLADRRYRLSAIPLARRDG